MNLFVGIVAGLVLLGILEKRQGGLAATLSLTPGPSVPDPIIPPQIPTMITAGGSVVEQQGLQDAQNMISSGLSAIPVVGGAVSGIFNSIAGGMLKAHQLRLQQAKSENQALNNFLPGWDRDIATVAAKYNRGLISANEALALFEASWNMFWAEITPHIQPGRNGCQSGANIPEGGVTHCYGDWGAACCVGGADIRPSITDLKHAIVATERTGQPASATIRQVFGSKYGGAARGAYTVSLQSPGRSSIGSTW